MPNEHELVYVFALLSDTGGMFVADRFLEARKISVPGVACGYVPGHGGDLHFVRHDGGEEADTGRSAERRHALSGSARNWTTWSR